MRPTFRWRVTTQVKVSSEPQMKSLVIFGALVGSLAMVASPAIARDTVTKAAVSTTTIHNNGNVTTSHTTIHKSANSNGLGTADRDLGLARAQERMSAQGRAHSQALKHHSTTTTTTTTHTR